MWQAEGAVLAYIYGLWPISYMFFKTLIYARKVLLFEKEYTRLELTTQPSASFTAAVMPYYDTVSNRSEFFRHASSEVAVSFLTLCGGLNCKTAASKWDRKYLFACKVLCSPESNGLPILASRIQSKMEDVHPCIRALVNGPRQNNKILRSMSELQIVREYENESLGYVWAGLAPLLPQLDEAPERPPPRNAGPPAHLSGMISSTDIQIGSSPPARPDSVSSGDESVGYVGKSSASG